MTSPIRRIMIVDDHDAVRRGVRNLVETKPYYQVVGEAANGRDALELARDTNPDITILDYSLPELNGLDLAHSLKRNHPRMEILLYTMHDREDVIFLIRHLGLKTAKDVLEIVSRYYPKERVPAKTRFLVEELLEGDDLAS